MNFRSMKLALVFTLCAIFAVSVQAQPQTSGAATPLTNAAVVKLVRAGFSDKTVISLIRARPSRFDLTPDRLIELKKSGVSEKIILAMIARDDETFVAAEDWDDDDGFFKDGGAGHSKGAPDPNSTDIFGMGGGSRGRTRSRAGSGGSDGDTQTTGSATVRILRPPAEAGGAGAGGAPKLEKTPTLTNESVVELVEAGFSEGTIIRRIEQSPAEFDLTAEKLAELRRRRVTEPVIAAMRAAMSDDGASARPEK